MARVTDVNLGKLIYARQGQTVQYYEDGELKRKMVGLTVSDGGVVGNYGGIYANRSSSRVAYRVRFPSDPTNPVRYVDAAQVDFESYKAPANPSGDNTKDTDDTKTVDDSNPFNPLDNKKEPQVDNTNLYLGLGLGAVVFVKMILPKLRANTQ